MPRMLTRLSDVAVIFSLSLAVSQPLGAQTLLCGPAATALDPMFHDVLQAPNDIELNLGFARKAIELEDFEAAVATMERLLMGRIDLPLIRLELGMLYLRLEAPRFCWKKPADSIKKGRSKRPFKFFRAIMCGWLIRLSTAVRVFQQTPSRLRAHRLMKTPDP